MKHNQERVIKMNKRKILAAAIAFFVLMLTACGNSSTAAGTSEASSELTPFTIGHLPATGHILFFIGYEEGFFADEGLDVTLKQFDNNTAELAALEAGKIDVAPINATNLINFVSEGHKLTSIGGVMSDGHALVVNKDVVEGVDPKDYSLELLKGKKIVLQAGSTYDVEFRMALKEAGIDTEKDLTIVSADSGTSAYNSLSNGEIAGAAVYAPFRQKAIDSGFVPLLYCDEIDYFDDPICCRSVALEENVISAPEKYEAYTRAMIRAAEFLENDHSKSIEDAKKYLDIDADILEKDTYNHSVNNPDPDEAKTVTFYNAMKELGYLDDKTAINISDYINNDIYENALNQLAQNDPSNEYYKGLLEYHEEAVEK